MSIGSGGGGIPGGGMYSPPTSNTPETGKTGGGGEVGANAEAQGTTSTPPPATPPPVRDGGSFEAPSNLSGASSSASPPPAGSNDASSPVDIPSLEGIGDMGDQAQMIAMAFKEKAQEAGRKMEQLGGQLDAAAKAKQNWQQIKSDAETKLEHLPKGDDADKDDLKAAADLQKLIGGCDTQIASLNNDMGRIRGDMQKLGEEIDQARAEKDRAMDSLKARVAQQENSKARAADEKKQNSGPQQKTPAQIALETLQSTVIPDVSARLKQAEETAQTRVSEESGGVGGAGSKAGA